uniref:Uncharacterized protein n=1 Tax=Varanus komodoensis TaxID=61221 RepID=A0A8D2L337_VARKO
QSVSSAFLAWELLIVDVILMIKVCKCFRHGLKGFSGFQLIRKDLPRAPPVCVHSSSQKHTQLETTVASMQWAAVIEKESKRQKFEGCSHVGIQLWHISPGVA